MFSTRSDAANIAAIAPPEGSACIRRPRAEINFKPSSKENTPAKQAATYSPTLWPINAAGCTPQDCHKRANAYSNENKAG